jgi:hypothetical protein
MQIAVVDPTQRHRELVTDLAPKGARLPKPDVMGIGRAPVTDEARFLHEVPERTTYDTQFRSRPAVL